MKTRHILLIILTLLMLVFLFFPSFRLAKARNDQQTHVRENESENLKITIYRYSPTELPSCEERFHLISNKFFIFDLNFPGCAQKINKKNLI